MSVALNRNGTGRVAKAGSALYTLFLFVAVMVTAFTGTVLVVDRQDELHALFVKGEFIKAALAQPPEYAAEDDYLGPTPAVEDAVPLRRESYAPESAEYAVQAVLSPKRQAVIASGIDAKIIKLKLESGDRFKKGEVLVEYDCAMDYARLQEAQSRQRVTQKQLEAFEKLLGLDSASEMEVTMARESNEQNKAVVAQVEGRLKYCRHVAPFDGRITKKMASQYETVQSGRVILDISSLEPLRAEFLIPSKWLRWLNVGTALNIYISETDRSYAAKIVAIHGEVDPVSQSIQVVAEMEDYHEELLPGMSGQAVFSPQAAKERGFLGLLLDSAGKEGHGSETE